MVSKGVNECKEKLQKLKFEMRKRGANQSVERILIGMFNSLCEKVEKYCTEILKMILKLRLTNFWTSVKKKRLNMNPS